MDFPSFGNNLNKAILGINVVILITIISGVTSSIIPKPLVFVIFSILNIFVCLCIWGFQEATMNRFYHENAGLGMQEFTFYNEGFANQINASGAISVVCFVIFYFIAWLLQKPT